jgi:hypothetical protein
VRVASKYISLLDLRGNSGKGPRNFPQCQNLGYNRIGFIQLEGKIRTYGFEKDWEETKKMSEEEF